jgi:phenylpyruvate tautomerase PptA (4-oxalocrotonate tautomerase family)
MICASDPSRSDRRAPYRARRESAAREKSEAIMVVFSETYDSRFRLTGSEAIMVVFSETDDSRFGLIGSEAIVVVFSETDDSRFGLIGSEAIVV